MPGFVPAPNLTEEELAILKATGNPVHDVSLKTISEGAGLHTDPQPQPKPQPIPPRLPQHRPTRVENALGPTRFQDTAGRIWDLKLTLAAAKRIDSSDFSEIYARKFSILVPDQFFMTEVLSHPGLIAAMVWAVLRPNAEGIGITEADFLESIDGKVMVEMRNAFWEAFLDFTQEQRTALEPLLAKYKLAQQKMGEASARMIAHLDPAIEEIIREEEESMATRLKEAVKKTRDQMLGGT